MPELPRGTVSFLFTDIEGSTRLLQHLREAYGDVLADHRRLLREAFEPAGGEELGTEGDAVFVVFRRARDAVTAAADAQRSLAAHPWPDAAEVRVRMGIHSGEPEMGAEGYHGLALHRAARICAAGHGGQILLSNATRELVEDDLPPGTSLRDLGEHRLKDLERPERIFQLDVEGLPSEFAPVRSLEAAPRRRWLRRPAVIAAALAALAAAVAIPVVALSGGSGGTATEVAPNSVAVIDPGTDEVVDQIGVGARPGALTSTRDALWVANLDDRSVSHIDLRKRQVVQTVPLGAVPGDIAAGSKAVWAVSADPRQDFAIVRRIDPTYDRVSRSIKVLGSPLGGGYGTVAADDVSVWAGTSGFGQVSRIAPESNSVVARLDPTPAPTSMAVGGGALWVGDAYTGNVTRVDADTGVALQTIPVGQGPNGLAYGAGALWVAASVDNAVVRIDSRTNVTTTIPVGRIPVGVAVGVDAVWVANSGDGTLSKIDPAAREVVETIPLGGSPQDVEVAAGMVWVSVQARVAEEVVARPTAAAHMATGDRVDSLDPAVASGDLQWQIEYATCAKLLNYPDRPAPEGSRLVPEVAESLPTVSADGRTYTFTIRKGFRFSPPSGEPVTAKSFAYAIERSLSPRMHRGTATDINRPQLDDVVGVRAYEAGAAHIAGIQARGNTLTIRLTAPAPDLPVRLAQPFFCAVPTGTPIEGGGVRSVPAAGPYYVAAFVPGERVVLKRNPNYGGSRPRRLRQIEITQGAPPRQLGGAASGDIDYAVLTVPPEQAARLAVRYGPASAAAKAGRQRYFLNPQLALDFLVLNARRPRFADARVRRAVAYAIDRTALAHADIVPAVPFDRFLPPGMPGATPNRIYPDRPDLARARRLARGAGGTAVFYTCNLLPCTQAAQIVKQNLAPIGIDVRIEPFPVARYFTELFRPGAPFDIAFFGHTANSTDPGAYLEGLELSRVLDDPVLERKLEAAARLSGIERERAYARLQVELTRDAAPLAIFAVDIRQDFFSARMGCQVYNPLYGMDLAALCVKR